MNFEEYHAQTPGTAVFPGEGTFKGTAYLTLGMAGEAGEIANQVKKVYRDDDGVATRARREKIASELGDLFWYLSMFMHDMNIDPATVFTANAAKLAKRKAAGTLQGDGEERTPPKTSVDIAKEIGERYAGIIGVTGSGLEGTMKMAADRERVRVMSGENPPQLGDIIETSQGWAVWVDNNWRVFVYREQADSFARKVLAKGPGTAHHEEVSHRAHELPPTTLTAAKESARVRLQQRGFTCKFTPTTGRRARLHTTRLLFGIDAQAVRIQIQRDYGDYTTIHSIEETEVGEIK